MKNINKGLCGKMAVSLAISGTSFASGGTAAPTGNKTGIKSSIKSGGVKPSTSTAATTTAPVVLQPVITGQLTFTAAASVNNIIPLCTGTYQIDPYYPTLSWFTLQVQASSMSVPDGTWLYITVNGVKADLSAFTTNTSMNIVGQAGIGSIGMYITPGMTVKSVLITDVNGTVISAGN